MSVMSLLVIGSLTVSCLDPSVEACGGLSPASDISLKSTVGSGASA